MNIAFDIVSFNNGYHLSFQYIAHRAVVAANHHTMSFTSIPILDLQLARDPATKAEFLTQLRHALMEVGFLYLKNVGISDELVQKVIEHGKAFFDIPLEEKQVIRPMEPGQRNQC